MDKETIITVLNDKGKLEEIEILKYFTLKSDQKDYIIYKIPNIELKNDSFIFAAIIEEDDTNISLKPIEDKKILEEIKTIMEEIYNGSSN